MPAPALPTEMELHLHHFCTNPSNLYIPANAKFRTFIKGKVSQLRFHQLDLDPDQVEIEIEVFASLIDEYLWALNYDASPSARIAIRSSIRNAADPIKGIVKSLDENYVRRR